jgi:hypothetical protein
VNSSDPTGCEGMIVYGSSPLIQNNIVSGGHASSLSGNAPATAITLLGSSTPVIENNIIITFGGDLRTGIWQSDSGSNPRRCNNNFFYGCPDGNYYYGPTNDAYQSAAGVLQTFLTGRGIEASGNVYSATDPGLSPADWRYTPASPASATAGGKDLSAEFATDIAGTVRTMPWSIGAFEKD